MALGRMVRDPEGAQQRVAARLARMHGLPQKIGQILSLTELESDSPIWTRLTEDSEAMPAHTAFAEIENALGMPVHEAFAQISGDGIAASLGQVHEAHTRSGTHVAVKIQYPGIAEATDSDLQSLNWLTTPLGGLSRGFDTAAYQREVGRMLTRELDYRHEARMLRDFERHTADWPQVRTPRVIESLSGARILTMTWIGGEPFSAVREWPQGARKEIAEILLRLFLRSCFEWRCVHADPHPGNYRFARENGQAVVGLLDFGCVKEIDAGVADGLLGLIACAGGGSGSTSVDRVMGHFLNLGFNVDLLDPMAHLLPELARVLFAPFRSRTEFDLTSWDLGSRVEQVLGLFRWNFRCAGAADLIFFMRAFQGLIQYQKALGAPICWRDVLQDIQPSRRSPAPPSPFSPRGESRPTKSSRLRVRVTEGGATKVDLTFRAQVADHLSDLLPEDVHAKLKARAVDVEAISRAVVAGDFAPGELFALDEDPKGIRVWLE